MRKATHINEIDQAVNKFEPVPFGHEFYTDFDGVRGDFQMQQLCRILNITKEGDEYVFNADLNRSNKTFLFLAGMRGTGKTSELAKYAKLFSGPRCFFTVVCNIDKELDMDKVQYMDVLIFQLQKLVEQADEAGLNVDAGIVNSMNNWFRERVKEINKSLTVSGSAEIEFDPGQTGIGGRVLSVLLGVTAKLKAGLQGSAERADKIRESFKNNFTDYAPKFNEFMEEVNRKLQKQGIAREVLFIIDGLEKTFTAEQRRRLILEESNRILKIKANTIFTLPVELIKEEAIIRQFSDVVIFPFIKVEERDGTPVAEAVERYKEFVCKRIDRSLFESEAVIEKAIRYSGGSPLQLLRILETANWSLAEGQAVLDMAAIDKSIARLANQIGRNVEEKEIALLKQLEQDLADGKSIGLKTELQPLLEKNYVFEYNDGSYKAINPLVKASAYYQQ
ncbi:MAG: hypothetical protein NW241_09340 [Bacteroidia bacterium]|nr:hypothetical protein [Bacteroidia bacterium]